MRNVLFVSYVLAKARETKEERFRAIVAASPHISGTCEVNQALVSENSITNHARNL